ncbi:MAG: PilZ domain-containing protein [Syntrophobacteraceae bacterium]
MIFEYRKYYRKPIGSNGKCFAAVNSSEGVSIKLVDISRSGIRFIKTDGKPLQLNKEMRVSFSLGGDTIFCAASVHNIRNECVGAKFKNLDEHSKKVLGFFLLP